MTSNPGSILHLSKVRSKSKMKYFIDKGINGQSIRAFGYGGAQPIADNATKEDHFYNTRIEILTDIDP